LLNRYTLCCGLPQPPLPRALPAFGEAGWTWLDEAGVEAFPASQALQRLAVSRSCSS
jgi:hypothetical protein